MSTVLDRPASARRPTCGRPWPPCGFHSPGSAPASRLTAEQKAEAAEPFNAEAKFLSAGKKLLDTTHPAYKAVTAVRGKVIAYWKSMSLAVPGAGHPPDPPAEDRRVRRQMREFQEELAEAVQALDRQLSRTESHGPAAVGQPLQQRRLSRVACRPVRASASIFRRWSRRTIFSNSIPQLYEQECERVQVAFR